METIAYGTTCHEIAVSLLCHRTLVYCLLDCIQHPTSTACEIPRCPACYTNGLVRWECSIDLMGIVGRGHGLCGGYMAANQRANEKFGNTEYVWYS